jgi:hypothetical protein
MLEHQGGDEVTLTPSATKFAVEGTTVSYGTVQDYFTAGDRLYIGLNGTGYTIGNSTTAAAIGNPNADIANSTETIGITIIDVGSQQMIATANVRF